LPFEMIVEKAEESRTRVSLDCNLHRAVASDEMRNGLESARRCVPNIGCPTSGLAQGSLIESRALLTRRPQEKISV
jgi:hypothetical protein